MIEILKNCTFEKHIKQSDYIDTSLYRNRQEYYVSYSENIIIKLYLRNFSANQIILHFVVTPTDPQEKSEAEDYFYAGNVIEFENTNKIGIYIKA